MNDAAENLTHPVILSVVRLMARVLRVRAAFEPSRTAAEQLQFAYEKIVAVVRRIPARSRDPVNAAPARPTRLAAHSRRIP